MTATIKLQKDYLERAVNFERLAAAETNPPLRAQFLDQAQAYRKLAARRADELGLPPPSKPELVRG
jgi:hypothetical protein